MSDIKLPPLPKAYKVHNPSNSEPIPLFTVKQLLAYARQCVLADRAAREDAWQPIATAPNSTREVLALSRNKRVSVEFGTYLCHMVRAANRDEDDCFYTHWMPLPAAPTQERGADDE